MNRDSARFPYEVGAGSFKGWTVAAKISEGCTVYIAYRHAPHWAKVITDPYGPLLCVARPHGLVTVSRPDGLPFLDGRLSFDLPLVHVVLNPPPVEVER